MGPICLRTSPRRLVRLESDYAEFHCCLVRRSVFERIGPADTQILGAAEHIDLALHLRAIGGRGFAEPEAVVSYLPSTTRWPITTTMRCDGATPGTLPRWIT